MIGETRVNEFGQPIGWAMGDWTPPPATEAVTLTGETVVLLPLDPAAHAEPLQRAFAEDPAGWTYLPYGPFTTVDEHRVWLEAQAASTDPLFFSIAERSSGRVLGIASYLRINPADGSIEIGHIHIGPELQRTRGSSEALMLLIGHAFALGYRRMEWKCDALNAPSRRAAQRLGLSFEGEFRQMTRYKGRNRDTAWFAATADQWPQLRAAYAAWLAPDNFDRDGRQRRSLNEWTAPLLRTRDGLQQAT